MNYIDASVVKLRSIETFKLETYDLLVKYVLIALAKGKDLNVRDVHNAWCADRAKLHGNDPDIVSYDDLEEYKRLRYTTIAKTLKEIS